MDPPPLPPLPATTTTTTTTVAATGAHHTTIHLNYPDSTSVESSPRSTTAADTYNEPLPPVPGAKLRIMCSYGGHIIPRPHDKSLCYVGGETRIVAIDRHSTLASLCSRLSRTLVNGRIFTLKYQLPNEDLDSLVSITTDEDLDNMIEEYDRITSTSSALAPSRIRLFLFFTKPETVASMGSLLDDAKSETWFVDALNGSGISRNLSDSATNCLVSIDNEEDLEAQTEGALLEDLTEEENKQAKNNVVLVHDVQASMPDSPMLENSSSFGSSSSSPSMSNLPPIRVRVEDQKGGIMEQFAQMTFAQVVQKQDDGLGLFSAAAAAAPPPLPTIIAQVGSSENLNRLASDDDKSDHGVPVAFRKPPLVPLQPVQQHKAGISYGLPSPDSVASDTSTASASSVSKPVHYQDHQALPPRAPASPDTKNEIPIPTSQIQIQQDSGYSVLDHQPQQQQFLYPSTQFVPQPAATPVPMPSYYPVYAATQQQAPHPPMDHQQYPVYVMPVSQTQTYMSMHANMMDNTQVVTSSRPLSSAAPSLVAASAAYTDSHPPIYPTKTTPTAAYPEMAATTMYRTAATTTPQLVQIPSNQFQQQYFGYSQLQHPSQSIAAAAANSNYTYDYTNATHDQVYYTTAHQNQAASALPPQFQTMTPTAAAAVALADTSSPLATSNSAQQIATSQP